MTVCLHAPILTGCVKPDGVVPMVLSALEARRVKVTPPSR
jgi:hypothetical protein